MAIIRLAGWGNQAVLDMRDAHNGLPLWQRPLPDASAATRTSGMVLLADALYLAEGPDVLMLNPASGQELGRIDCAALGKQVKWLAVQAGTMYAMAGSKEEPVMAHETWKIAGSEPPNFGKCGAVRAYGLAGKKWLWTQEERADAIDEGMVGMNDGKLYYEAAEQGLICRDVTTGKVVWRNPQAASSVTKFIKRGDTRGHVGAIVCSDKVVAIHRANCGTVVISATTGEAWNARAASILFAKDVMVRKGGSPAYLDPLTGKEAAGVLPKFNLGAGCGAFTISSNLVCGQMGVTFDLTNRQPLDNVGCGPLFHKTPCLSGSFVGEGLVAYASASCVCGYHVRGMIVQGSDSLSAADSNVVQLAQRAGSNAAAPPFPVDDRDWPAFRGGATRANASRAEVSATTPAAKWTWKPTAATTAQVDEFYDTSLVRLESAHEPMQATCAGNLVFVTSAEAPSMPWIWSPVALRRRFITGGRLSSPPTIAADRCYIGSGDGVVYCLEAATGRELWHYRVAPSTRLMMVYGDLESRLPVTGGVLVHNGVAYAIAGNLDVDGTYVVALDARTGAVKWRNDSSGHLNAQRGTGVSGCGSPAIAKGRLWLRRASFDLATGECRPAPEPLSVAAKRTDADLARDTLQRYTGCFADRFLVYGGRRFFSDQCMGMVSNSSDFDSTFFMEAWLTTAPASFP